MIKEDIDFINRLKNTINNQLADTKIVNTKEAISKLKEEMNYSNDNFDLCNYYSLALSALKKQIPQMVYLQGDGYADGYLVYDEALCPECGYMISDVYDPEYHYEPYCPHCGQALDWNVLFDLEEEDND